MSLLTPHDVQTMLRAAPPAAWRPVTIGDTRVERRWITLLQHASEGNIKHHFGILDDGTWSALYADENRVFPHQNRVPFLPLLEKAWTDVAREIVSGLSARGLPTKLAWSFPLDEVIVLALRSSDHWRANAERWISSNYPMTDEIAALLPRHPRSRARSRGRMAAIFDIDNDALRTELEAALGSFLSKLRAELTWDPDAFNKLTSAMDQYVRERDHDAPIPRWVADQFWFLDWWVKEWSRHENFPRPYSERYYEAAYDRLHALAFWLFNGTSMYEEDRPYAPLRP